MSENLRTSVILDLKGNLERQARRYGNAMTGMARRGNRSLKGLNTSFKRHSKLVTGITRRYGALAAAAGVAASASNVINRDARLTQLQADGRVTAEQVDKLKESLFQLANDPDIRLDPDLLLGGVEEIITRTGDFDFAIKNLRNLALVIRATASTGKDVGSVFSLAYKGGLRDADELLRVNGALLDQTLQGSVAFRDIAKVGKKLIAPALSKRGANFQTFLEAGAIAQIVIDAVGSPDEATEATKAFLAALVKSDVIKTLRDQAGINVLQDDGKLQSLPVLIEEIFKASGGNFGLLGETFGESGVKVFEGFSLPGNKEQLRRLSTIESDGSLITKNARLNASTAKAATRRVGTTFEDVTDKAISDSAKIIAGSLDRIDRGKPILDELGDLAVTGFKDIGQAFVDFNELLKGSKIVPQDDELKATVEIKVEGPATVKKVNRRGRTSNFNVDVVQDNGATMVTQ